MRFDFRMKLDEDDQQKSSLRFAVRKFFRILPIDRGSTTRRTDRIATFSRQTYEKTDLN